MPEASRHARERQFAPDGASQRAAVVEGLRPVASRRALSTGEREARRRRDTTTASDRQNITYQFTKMPNLGGDASDPRAKARFAISPERARLRVAEPR